MKNGWGLGTFGYYHLFTKLAQEFLYACIFNIKVNVVVSDSDDDCCASRFGTPSPRTVAIKLLTIQPVDRNDMRLLFHARSVASKPNDGQARADQLCDATNTSKAYYNIYHNGEDIVVDIL